MPTAILRRYTPPTCTLEVTADQSALSRWSDQPVAKRVRFQLRFDDPRLSDAEHFAIAGNGTQLDTLYRVVDDYVQQLIEAKPLAWAKQSLTTSGNQPQAAPLSQLHPAQVARERHAREKRHQAHAASAVQLVPRAALSHDLYLGDLANEESGPVVTLNTSQLFDLSTALDDYARDILTLPARTRKSWQASSWSITQTVATFVLAAGITAAIFKYVADVASPPGEQVVLEESAPETGRNYEPESPEVAASPFTDWTTIPNPTAAPPAASQAPGSQPSAAGNSGESSGNADQGTTNEPGEIPALPPIAPIERPPANSPAAGTQPNPSLPTAPAPEARSSPASPGSRADAPATLDSAPPPTTESIPTPITPPTPSDQTMFDVIPQVGEVRGYFQQNWTPPATLSQPLEYRLVIGADGSLQEIFPLGQASRLNIDQLNLPPMGEPFVSQLTDSEEVTIRLMLTPDRTVRTFLEGSR
jgi:hypothetical protein